MQPNRSMAFLAASVVLFHYWVTLIPDSQAPFAQAILHLSFLMLLLCFCSEHCAELFDRAVENCMHILDSAGTALVLLVYKTRHFIQELKQMDGIGHYRCICGSGKLMSNCCGKGRSANR